MSRTNCPTLETLEELALGAGPSEAIDKHLAACTQCRSDLERMRSDNALLRAYAGSKPNVRSAPSSELLSLPGYEILHEIERGGQGVVYAARQISTQRDVAIKVLRKGALATQQDRSRFAREVETLARLDHPNIVTVHDAGSMEGCHYIVMDLVDGTGLQEWATACRRRHAENSPKATNEILEVFTAICAGVHAAHLRGVMHRDLKPSNIQVDRSGRARILDFGLAKPLDGLDSVGRTHTGQFVGSLLWASPEQIRGDRDATDLRTDIYSLGVILFHLLTEEMPFALDSNLHVALDELLTRPPPLPSEVSGVLPGVTNEMDTIVHRCLAKDPVRRYQSAADLAGDIRRYQSGEPIEARRDSALYLLQKTLGRYRRRVLLVGGLLTLSTVFAVVMTIMYQRSVELERRAVEDARSYARLLSQGNIERGRLAGALGNFTEAENLLWEELLRAPGAAAGAPLADPPGDRRAYWALWDLYRQQPCRRTIPLPPQARTSLLVGNDILTIDATGTRTLYSPEGRILRTATLSRADAGLPQAFADGQVVLSITPDRYLVWRAGTPSPILDLAHDEGTRANATISPRGDQLAYIDNGSVQVVHLKTGERAGALGDGVAALAISHDGQRLATRNGTGRLTVWDLSDGTPIVSVPGATVARTTPQAQDLAFGPDDTWLVDAWIGGPGRIVEWTGAAPRVTSLPVESGNYRVVGFADDDRFALGDLDGNVRVFLRNGQLLNAFSVGARIRNLAFAPDQGLWITCDDRLQHWLLSPEGHVQVFRTPDEQHFHTLASAPDGVGIVAGGGSGQVFLLDDKREWSTLRSNEDSIVPSIAIAPDGTALAAARYAGVVEISSGSGFGRWDHGVQRLPHPSLVSHVCYSPDGERLATAGGDGVVRIWDRAGTLLRALQCGSQRLPQVAFDATSQRLGIAARDGALWIWQRGRDAPHSLLEPSASPIRAVAFLPDGRLLAGGAARTLQVIDVEDRRASTLEGATHEIYCVTSSPDGERVAAGDAGGAIYLWAPDRARPLLTLEGHGSAVMAVQFVTATELWSASLDGTLRRWDLTAYEANIRGQVEQQLRRLGWRDVRGADAWKRWSADQRLHPSPGSK